MDDIDVSKVATRFNGGGHIRASGLTLRGDYDKALNALLLECKKEINK
jgi:nanoRNase/pAp phosphatase (c-di-AMP/oligoRNAs hydrolase)